MPGSIHVAPGVHAAEKVRVAIRKAGVAEDVIPLRDPLNVGPLWDLERGGAARLEFWKTVCSHDPQLLGDIDIREEASWSVIRSATTITVWHGPHPFEYFVPIRLAAALVGRCQLFEVVRPASPRRVAASASHLAPFYDAVNLASPTELFDLLPTKRPITDAAGLAAVWRAMTDSRETLFRELHDGKLVELPADGHDDEILSNCSADWTTTVSVIAHVLVDTPVSSAVIAWRIRALVHRGVLEGRGTGEYGVAELRRPS